MAPVTTSPVPPPPPPPQAPQQAQPQTHDRPSTPDEAWHRLQEGNARFVQGLASAADTGHSRRAELMAGQRPLALVFGCSDSRVPAEIVFDQGLGDLFVVRTAGHVVDTAVLGSVEFGVSDLGVPLVVVMGHEECGAVRATVEALEDGALPGGYVRDLVERITPSVLTARKGGASTHEAVQAEHVRLTARMLVERSVVLSRAVESRRCAIVGLTYALSTGQVRLIDALGHLEGAPAEG